MNDTLPQLEYFDVIFLRHGESTGNANGFHQGQHDFPLSDLGIAQARQLADHWAEQHRSFDLIITSPLSRAYQTAEIISHTLHLPLETDPIWMERDAGVLSGLHHEEARQRFPRPDFLTLYDKIGKTGESQWELFLRAGAAVNQLVKRPPARYLVVSHGAILNMVLYAALGIFPQPNFYGAAFAFENTSYAHLNFYPQNHNWLFISLQHPPYQNYPYTQG